MIIIAGDSWGEGYYQLDPDGSRWPGFHHYWAQRGKQAINISHGGNSNHQSFSDLEVFLASSKPKMKRVIVWLTCVLRDYPPDHAVDNIEHWVTRHYENIFDRAITLAHFYDCRLELLGGLGDIPRSFPEKLSSRVSIRCYSTIKYVDPDYAYEMPYGHITQVDRIPDANVKSKLIEHIEPKYKYLRNPNGHCPGGHLGADQYQKIYEFLK
jgi:hypothetical protein